MLSITWESYPWIIDNIKYLLPASFVLGVGTVMTLLQIGNAGLGTATFGTNAARSLGIAIGTEPATSIANQIEIYARDTSVGAANATIGLRTEQGVEAIGTFTPAWKLRIYINGVEYWIQLDPVG